MIKQFIRDPETHVKTGIMVALVDGNQLCVGFSVLHSKDEGKFDRDFGEEIAVSRAICYNTRYPGGVPFKVREMLPAFAARCKTYFKDMDMPDWVDNICIENAYGH